MNRRTLSKGQFWRVRTAFCLGGIWLLLTAAGAGQAIELKGHRPPPPSTPESPLPAADAPMLALLPLEKFIRVPRSFESQSLDVEIFRFADPDSAFCAFTFLRKPGVKPYSERLDSVVQSHQLLLWQGRQVCRTTFQDITRAHVGAYLDWLRSQLSPPRPAPDYFQKLPPANCRPESCRYVVNRDLLVLALGEPAAARLPFTPGERLVLARYWHPDGDYWCGWHLPVPGKAPSLPAPEAAPDFTGMSLRTRRLAQATAFYYGPDAGDRAEAVLDGLQQMVARNLSSGGIDPSRFFRRDQISYGQLIVTGFKLVGVLFLIAVGIALVVTGIAWTTRRLRRRESGLGYEGLVWLRLVKGRARVDPAQRKDESAK